MRLLIDSDVVWTPENASGQGDDGFDEIKNGTDRNTQQPEWQEQKPDKGVEDDREQCQGPAQNQQDEPQDKGQHRKPPSNPMLLHNPAMSIKQQ